MAGTRSWARAGLRGLLAGSTILVAWAAGGSFAAAQDEPGVTDSEAVVITARRRAEELQEVPLSVSVLNQEEMREASIDTPMDLQFALPGLVFTQSSDTAQNSQFNIRGSGQSFGGSLPGVITYFADVPLDFHGGAAFSMFDLQNVQVARGPQGTLFGRNATGGAVLLVPSAPEHSFGGYADIRAGNYNLAHFRGAVNLPITQSLAARVSADVIRRDGHTLDLFDNSYLADQNSDAFRLFVRWDPADFIRIDAIYQTLSADEAGTPYILDRVRPDGNTGATRSALDRALHDLYGGPTGSQQYLDLQRARGPFVTHTNGRNGMRREIDLFVNTVNVDVTDNLTVRSILGYERVKTWYGQDIDGSPQLVNYSHALQDEPSLEGPESDLEQYTWELQLLGESFNGRLEWILGAFLFDLSTPQIGFVNGRNSVSNLTWVGDGVPAPSIYSYSRNSATVDDGSEAVFGQATLALDELLSGLTLTAGYRYTWDSRSTTLGQLTERTTGGANGTDELPPFTCATAGIPATGLAVPDAVSEDQCLRTITAHSSADGYTLGLDWQMTDDVLLYVVTRSNYKAGGQNFINTLNTGLLTYQPEYATDYEIGIKSDWDLGWLSGRTNLALYRAEYEDLQRNVTINTGIAVATVVYNAASATIDGVEFENTLRFGDRWELETFYTWTDARYETFINPADLTDLSADKFVGTPEHAGGARLSYTHPLGAMGDIRASISGYSQDEMAYRANQIQNLGLIAPGYTTYSARVTWRDLLGHPVDVSIWGNNITDEEYIVAGIGLYGTTLGYNSVVYGDPQMYGVELVWRFGD